MSYENYAERIGALFAAPLGNGEFDFTFLEFIQFIKGSVDVDPETASLNFADPIIAPHFDAFPVPPEPGGEIIFEPEISTSGDFFFNFWARVNMPDEVPEGPGSSSPLMTIGDTEVFVEQDNEQFDEDGPYVYDLRVSGGAVDLGVELEIGESYMVTVSVESGTTKLYIGTEEVDSQGSALPALNTTDSIEVGGASGSFDFNVDCDLHYLIIVDSSVDAELLENLHLLGAEGQILYRIESGSTIDVADGGAVGFTADWHIVSV